jgi:two-component system, NarL family, response regulator NreC
MEKTSLYLTDDHELYLEGLSLVLKREEDLQVLGTFNSGAGLLKALADKKPDILVMDVHMPGDDPEELLKKIQALHPEIKILYLTLMRGTRFVHRLQKYGIKGYLLKSSPVEELLKAIRAIAAGGEYYSEEIDVQFKEDDIRNTILIDDRKVKDILTKREMEILQLVCKEYSNAEIADKLFLSVGTVETHRKNLIAKLGVSNTVGLVKYAFRHNLIEDF